MKLVNIYSNILCKHTPSLRDCIPFSKMFCFSGWYLLSGRWYLLVPAPDYSFISLFFLLNCRDIVAIAIPFQGKEMGLWKGRGTKGSVSKAEGLSGMWTVYGCIVLAL